jgi:hypothetical protein
MEQEEKSQHLFYFQTSEHQCKALRYTKTHSHKRRQPLDDLIKEKKRKSENDKKRKKKIFRYIL